MKNNMIFRKSLTAPNRLGVIHQFVILFMNFVKTANTKQKGFD